LYFAFRLCDLSNGSLTHVLGQMIGSSYVRRLLHRSLCRDLVSNISLYGRFYRFMIRRSLSFVNS
jgi:hypothetical protein